MTMVEDYCHGTPRLWRVLWEVHFLNSNVVIGLYAQARAASF